MAIAATVLDSGISTTDGTSFATASISPAANSLLLVFGASSGSTLAPTITASGLSLSWTTQKDQPFGSSTTDVRRLAAFTAQCGGAPGSGAITLSMDATSTHAAWLVIEITGHDTSAPIPQAVSGKDDSTSATSLPLTLAAPVDANSRAFSWWGSRSGAAGSPQTNWTELYDMVTSSPSMSHEGQWRSDAFDTAADVTFPAQRIGGIALEVAVATAGGTPAEVFAVLATATAAALEPTVSGETAVTASEWAQATAQAHAPTVTGSGTSDVIAVTAQATAAAQAPVVTGTALVLAVAVTATAQAGTPTITAIGAGHITAPAATATAQAVAPAVSSVGSGAVVAVVATATAQGQAPSVTAVAPAVVLAAVAAATAAAFGPTVDTTTFLIFEPPTYELPAPPPPGVRHSLYGLTESMSVVRINGTFQTVKTPFAGALTTAGVEGEDYFLGGRIYRVSPETATELTNAGYTVT